MTQKIQKTDSGEFNGNYTVAKTEDWQDLPISISAENCYSVTINITNSTGAQILHGSNIQHGQTNQAAGRNFTAPGQIIDGVQLNAMEQDLIDTMRRGNLSDWTKISAILENIKGRSLNQR